MFECTICNKEFETKQSFGGHMSSHNREAYCETRKELRLIKKSKPKICKYCGSILENGWKLGAHIANCKLSPKINDTRKKQSDAAKRQIVSKDTRQKHSDRAKRLGFGGVRQSCWIKYNGKMLGSSYELTVAKNLDLNHINWDTCKAFNYIDPFGKSRKYTPDFYLTDFNVYLDPKNDFLLNYINPRLKFTDIEKIKLVETQNNIRVIILNKDQLSWQIIKTLI